jgi:hypothetical protein
MTDALAIRPSQELIPETRNMESLAKHLLESGLFPNVRNVAGAITVIEYGRELGIPPVCALQTMVIIRGKLTMEAKAMLAVASNRAGVSWKIIKLDDTGCTMSFMRPGFDPAPVSFTYDEAKAAGLTDKDNWKLYRQDMLFARCASRGVRRIAPDAVLGLYSTEEMRDVEAIEKMKIKVPSDQEIIETEKAEKAKKEEPKEEEWPVYDGPLPSEEDAIPVPFEDTPPPTEKGEDREDVDDPMLNSYIAQIRHGVERSGIDEKLWKEWLLGQGKKMNRQFVGRIGRAIRYHKGKPEDVKYLQEVLDKAISLYVKETSK